MFLNFFVSAWRNLLKNRSMTLINIAGLTFGMASCLLIFLYVRYELSYDRHFPDADRTLRIGIQGKIGGRSFKGITTQAPLAAALKKEFPEVEETVRLNKGIATALRYENETFFETSYFYADSTFFNVFPTKVIAGNAATALTRPYCMAISTVAAKKYFGNEDPLGKTIHESDGNDFEITAVFEPLPVNTHFHVDFLTSLVTIRQAYDDNWLSDNLQTYVILKPGTDYIEFEAKLDLLIQKYVGPLVQDALGVSMENWKSQGNNYQFFCTKLTDIHLRSDCEDELEPQSDIGYIRVLMMIAAFVMIIACINFMNLSTARSASRAREVGIRKVLGSYRSSLMYQFLTESVILSLISMVLSVIVVAVALPNFEYIIGKQLSVNLTDPFLWLTALGLVLISGIFAGIYPATALSSFNLLLILKGRIASGHKANWFRSGLVVFQFTISVAILVSTIFVFRQIQYIKNKPLGFNTENVFVVDRLYGLDEQAGTFIQTLMTKGSVEVASASSAVPFKEGFNGNVLHIADESPEEIHHFRLLTGGYNFQKVWELRIKEGRYFDENYMNDSSGILINETTVRNLGLTNPVGTFLKQPDEDHSEEFKIIGVVEDFHFEALDAPVQNVIFRNPRTLWMRYGSVRAKEGRMQEAIADAEALWKELKPQEPFIYFLPRDEFVNLHRATFQTGMILTIFAGLALFIGCLGLFALTSFTTEQKTREIGIRKVMGATVKQVIVLLSTQTVKWVIIANIIGLPIAGIIVSNWLENYAYRINLEIFPFVAGSLGAIVIALLTVSFQTIKAALANPSDALKYE